MKRRCIYLVVSVFLSGCASTVEHPKTRKNVEQDPEPIVEQLTPIYSLESLEDPLYSLNREDGKLLGSPATLTIFRYCKKSDFTGCDSRKYVFDLEARLIEEEIKSNTYEYSYIGDSQYPSKKITKYPDTPPIAELYNRDSAGNIIKTYFSTQDKWYFNNNWVKNSSGDGYQRDHPLGGTNQYNKHGLPELKTSDNNSNQRWSYEFTEDGEIEKITESQFIEQDILITKSTNTYNSDGITVSDWDGAEITRSATTVVERDSIGNWTLKKTCYVTTWKDNPSRNSEGCTWSRRDIEYH